MLSVVWYIKTKVWECWSKISYGCLSCRRLVVFGHLGGPWESPPFSPILWFGGFPRHPPKKTLKKINLWGSYKKVLKIKRKHFGNFLKLCFWAHWNLDAPCGSKSGLVLCDGREGKGKRRRKMFPNCLMFHVRLSTIPFSLTALQWAASNHWPEPPALS